MMKQKLINYQREENHEFVDQVLKPTAQPIQLQHDYKEEKDHNITNLNPIGQLLRKKTTFMSNNH